MMKRIGAQSYLRLLRPRPVSAPLVSVLAEADGLRLLLAADDGAVCFDRADDAVPDGAAAVFFTGVGVAAAFGCAAALLAVLNGRTTDGNGV